MDTNTTTLSKINQTTVRAFELGYRVTVDGQVMSPKGKIRKCHITRDRLYVSVHTIPNANPQRVWVHKLCAYQQFGYATFTPGIVIRHLNGISTDNRHSNIAIGSQSQNIMDRTPEDRREQALIGVRCVRKLSYNQANEIRNIYSLGGVSQKELRLKYGLSKSGMSYLLRGKTYVSKE